MKTLNRNLLPTALLAATLCALPALASVDNFGVGDGHTGPVTVGAANTVINQYAQVTAPAAPGDTAIVVGTNPGFVTGDLVLVMQMTGIVPEPPSGGPTPVDLTNNPVGRWELARLSSVAGTTLNMTAALVSSYAANVTQVIRVPEYTTVSIAAGRSLTAPAWNGSTGGVMAFMANGAVTNNGIPGVLVTGKGFRGGVPADDSSGSVGCAGPDEPAASGAQKGEGVAFTRYGPAQTGRGRVANGGGGGVCYLAGGGGGGNGGAGGQGGDSADGPRSVGGEGGAALSFSPVDHLLMGGGGGSAHMDNGTAGAGGAGGGIAFIRAASLVGAGSMQVNGAPGGNTTGNDAASGGGAGGSLYLRVSGGAACGAVVTVGGNGASANSAFDVGPGGSGGGGRILFQRGSGTCAPTAAATNPGNAGVQADSGNPNYGATQGQNGSVSTLTGNFVLPPPVVNTPANASRTNNPKPPYTGTLATTVPAGTQVAIYVDGVQVAVVTPDASGNWTFTPTVALAEGSHTLSAVARNTVQAVESVKSNTNTFIVDTTPPAPPVVSTPANGSVTSNNKPTYTGTAEPLSTVNVFVDGVSVGTTVATAAGTWTLVQPSVLPDGPHSVNAKSTDAAGNVSATSNTNTFTVDTQPPTAPVVTTPADGARTTNNKPLYRGTAEPNSTVTVYVDGVVAGTATADASGNWVFPQVSALADGSHAVKATSADAAGNISVDSNINTFLVDTVPPPAPVVQQVPDGAVISDNTPDYSGTASGASTVTVYVNGVQVGVTVVIGGLWNFTQPTPLPDGVYTVMVISMDGAGNISPNSNTNTFTVDTAPPPPPVVVTPPDGSRSNTLKPTYTGTAEAGSTVTVYVDNVVVGTVVASASGAWSFPQPTNLSEGSHTVKATATDTVGNVGGFSNINTFTIDTTPPPAPVVATPANGSRTNNPKPGYTGTAEPGSTVSVYVDNVVVGTVVADASGNWTFAQPTNLSEGSHTVKATATDAAGNVSVFSNTNTFTVDLTAPAAPVVATPANGSRTNNPKPPYTGTAEPGSTVSVYVDNVVVGTVVADASGNWTFAQPTNLAEGAHTVKATATDVAGNVSVFSNINTFTVDLTAPAAPVVATPANGSSTNDTTPDYTGTAEAGSTVSVYVDNVVVGTTIATAAGTWSFTQPAALATGSHTVKVTATDVAGNVSVFSNINTFTVDLTPPAAPVVQTPTNGSRTNDTTPTYSGTAEPGSTVSISVDGTVVGTALADASGSWSFTPTTPLAEGSHSVNATATDAAGNTGPQSNTNTFTVDLTAPSTPTVVTPANGSRTNDTTPTYSGTADPGSTVTIYVDGTQVGTAITDASGNWTFTPTTPLAEGAHMVSATATDSVGNTSGQSPTNTFTVDVTAPAAPVVATPANGSRTNDTTPTYSGTAEPGSTVTVIVDGAVIGTTTANALGSWTFTPTTPLPEGSHTVAATATDVAGNTSPQSNTNTFTVDLTPPGAPVVTSPANGSSTHDTTPTYTGTAEPGSTVTVTVDGTVVGTTTADASGNWSVTPTTPLPEGSHSVTAAATDAAGNTGPQSNTNTFTVDLTAPAAPVVTAPANGAILGDNTPTYTGTAEANSTVTVIVDGSVVGTTPANASGAWSLTPTTGLANGDHMVKATSTDAAGNVSPDSNTNTFRVDATVPSAPVVTGPATNGTVTNDNTPTFTGTAAPGSTVTVILNGNAVGTTTADASGHWTFTPTTPLPDGPYTLTATATNAAGNVSPSSNSRTFVVDTALPETQIITGPSGDTDTPDASFDLGSNEAGVTYECSLDGGDFTACSDPATFEGLANGEHTLQVRARDSAGNVDTTPATRTWNVLVDESLNFRGGGVGCASSGANPSALAMMGLAVLSALLARKRRA
jgi:hypothetical protein